MSSNDDLKKAIERVRELERKTRYGHAGTAAERDDLMVTRGHVRELKEKARDEAERAFYRTDADEDVLRGTAATPDPEAAAIAWYDRTDPAKKRQRRLDAEREQERQKQQENDEGA